MYDKSQIWGLTLLVVYFFDDCEVLLYDAADELLIFLLHVNYVGTSLYAVYEPFLNVVYLPAP